MDYEQVCGLLGLLKADRAPIDFSVIDAEMKTASANRTHEEWASGVHRKYRDMVLARGLLRVGELANASDAIPLVG